MNVHHLPAASAPAPAPAVLACGAWLKNSACLLQGDALWLSDVHGDLGQPDNCRALQQSVQQLRQQGGAAIGAVAHDLHPDFFSTQLAQEVAAQLGVPALAVQHHHAHIGAVMAEHGVTQPVIGLALDGVGLGSDGQAWGGELLHVHGAHWQRLGHLSPLALPGGDTAAREPWRMAAAALHALGRGAEIVGRLAPVVGAHAAQTVHTMLMRGLNCPGTSSAGRWFDAAAGLLGLSVRQVEEAQAAIALEQQAQWWLDHHPEPVPLRAWQINADGVLDLRPLAAILLAYADHFQGEQAGTPIQEHAQAQAAAVFHLELADALAQWAWRAAQQHGTRIVALGGGCFFNRILRTRLVAGLAARDVQVLLPGAFSCGDAGLALGQAWVAREMLRAGHINESEVTSCV